MKFADLGLNQDILNALSEAGFSETTTIQEKAIPAILQGKDIIAQSMTGSGKTAAFGLPIIQKLAPTNKIHALVLTPTRELCVQVSQAIGQFGKFTGLKTTMVFGGVDIEPQMSALRHADIVVGTPGRILDHMHRGSIDFTHLKFLVLDEVDRMADMGFIDDVERIVSGLPKHRQTLLFSATMTQDVTRLASRHLKEPVMIKAETYVDEKLLKQVYYNVQSSDKFSMLVHLLKTGKEGLKLVFCATRHEVDIVTENLRMQGINVMAIHGGLTQNNRMRALDSLREEKIDVLVATDVAARGLDIKNVEYVFNYDVPKTAIEYLHRIGRTARAGESGIAVSILCEPDYENFRRILRDKPLDIQKAPNPKFERVRFDRYINRQRPHLPGRGFSGQGRGFGQRTSGPRRSFGSGPRRDSGPRSFGQRRESHSSDTHSERSPGSDSSSYFSDSEAPRQSGSRSYGKPGFKKSFGHGSGSSQRYGRPSGGSRSAGQYSRSGSSGQRPKRRWQSR
jgi:superfamily II DNA/RNA helicase